MERFLGLRFFHKASDPAGIFQLHDAEAGCRLLGDGKDGNGDFGLAFSVGLEEMAKIHPIKLIA